VKSCIKGSNPFVSASEPSKRPFRGVFVALSTLDFWAFTIHAMLFARLPQRFAKLVLVWFVLTIGASIASPLVTHKITSFACTSMGVKIIEDGKDVSTTASSAMECPYCANFVTPLVEVGFQPVQFSPLAHALQSIERAHIASATAPPLPSRGPPAIS
jgi:hypothetical protein